MVYGIIHSHNGHLTVHSELGRGTQFNIYLPIAKEKEKIQPVEKIDIPIIGGKETILVIDDEKEIRSISEKILNKYGYTTLTANDGQEGLNIYRNNMDSIDLIILDLVMPIKGGAEVLAEVKKMNPSAKVLIASGYSTNGTVKDALEKGSKSIVNKPYTLRELLSTVRETLDDKGEKP